MLGTEALFETRWFFSMTCLEKVTNVFFILLEKRTITIDINTIFFNLNLVGRACRINFQAKILINDLVLECGGIYYYYCWPILLF